METKQYTYDRCMEILKDFVKKYDEKVEADVREYARLLNDIEKYKKEVSMLPKNSKTLQRLFEAFVPESVYKHDCRHFSEIERKEQDIKKELKKLEKRLLMHKEYYELIREKNYETLWKREDFNSQLAAIYYAYGEDDKTYGATATFRLTDMKTELPFEVAVYLKAKAIIVSQNNCAMLEELEKIKIHEPAKQGYTLEKQEELLAVISTMHNIQETEMWSESAEYDIRELEKYIDEFDDLKEKYQSAYESLKEQVDNLHAENLGDEVSGLVIRMKEWFVEATTLIAAKISERESEIECSKGDIATLEKCLDELNSNLKTGVGEEALKRIRREMPLVGRTKCQIELPKEINSIFDDFQTRLDIVINAKKAEVERRKAKARQAAIAKENRRALLKKVIPIVILLFLLLIAGIIFYLRYMTNTYYGTSFYLGTNYNYEEYEIADSVKEIAPGTFKGMEIKSITIPESIEIIGDEAFAECESLREVVFEDGLTSIGNKAFYGCKALEEVTLPDSLTMIGNEAFSGCEALKEIAFPENLTGIGREAFSNCYALEKIDWNENLQEFGERAFAFAGLKTLDGVSLEMLKNINYTTTDIFANCRNLKVTEEQMDVIGFGRLYHMAAPGAALVENEQQLINLLAGEAITENVWINPYKGQLTNIKFEENKQDKALFSLEYIEDGYIYNVTGNVIRENAEAEEAALVHCEFDEVRTFFDKDILLTTDSEGNYTNLLPMINAKSLVYGDTTVTLENREIKNLEVLSVDEQIEGEDKSITVGVKGQVLGGFTTYSFEGSLKVASAAEGVTSELTTTSLSDSGISFIGVYQDGDNEVRITGQLGDYLYLGNSGFIDTAANSETGFYYLEYRQYSSGRQDVSIDYDNGIINIEGRELKKIGELEEGASANSGFTGIWKGNMLDRGIPYTAYCFDNGDGTASAVMEWAYTTAKGTPRYGTYVSQWYPDEKSGKLKMNHGGFYELTDGYHQRVFYGTLSGDGNSIATDDGTFVRQ